MDRKLKLRADHWSEGAAQVATSDGLEAKSFERAAAAYSRAVGGAISAESVRTITEGWGAECEAKRVAEAALVNAPAQRGEAPAASRLTPVAPLTGHANISSDGAKLLIRSEGWKEVKMTAISAVTVTAAGERAAAGERPSRRDCDPLVELTRHSYQAGLWEVEDFARQQYAEGVRRGIEQCTTLSSVNDGALWIERATRENFPAAVQVIDWSHAEERLGLLAAAATCSGGLAGVRRRFGGRAPLDRCAAGPLVGRQAARRAECLAAPRAHSAAHGQGAGQRQHCVLSEPAAAHALRRVSRGGATAWQRHGRKRRHHARPPALEASGARLVS